MISNRIAEQMKRTIGELGLRHLDLIDDRKEDEAYELYLKSVPEPRPKESWLRNMKEVIRLALSFPKNV